MQQAIAAGDLAAADLRSGTAHDRAALLESIVDRISLGDGGIEIMISPALVRASLDLNYKSGAQEPPIILALPATKVRRGHQCD